MGNEQVESDPNSAAKERERKYPSAAVKIGWGEYGVRRLLSYCNPTDRQKFCQEIPLFCESEMGSDELRSGD